MKRSAISKSALFYFFRICIFFSLCVTCAKNAWSTHVAGAEMEYECIGLRKWKIKLHAYANCGPGTSPFCEGSNCAVVVAAVPAPSVSAGGLNPEGCTAPSATVNVVLRLVSVEDTEKSRVTRCGVAGKSNCTNMGSVAAGHYLPGYERYTFEGIMDLSSSEYSPGNICPYWNIQWFACCRSSAMNIWGQPTFFLESTINIFDQGSTPGGNSSPVFRQEASITFCAGVEQVFNFGAVDPDHDSLSYEIIKAMSGSGTNLDYILPYDERTPFPLVATAPPHSAFPDAPFVVLDPVTGDISLNALNTTTSPIAGNFVVRIKQWRHREEPAGSRIMKPYITGITMRDIPIFSIACPLNMPPRFRTVPALPNGSPKYNWSVCAGEQICFTIKAGDEDSIDHTTISWDKGIVRDAGKLSFGPDYDASAVPPEKPREDRWKFCWQTETSDISALPYYFSVRADDNKCPNGGRIIKAFSVNVRPKVELSLERKGVSCWKWAVDVKKIHTSQVLNSAVLEVGNVPGDRTFINGAHVKISSNPNPSGSGTAPVTLISDTIRFTKPGMYFLRYTAITENCTHVFYDSLYMDTPVSVNIPSTITKCKNDSVFITASFSGGTGPYTYRWYRNTTQGVPVNGPNFMANVPVQVKDTIPVNYILRIQDFMDCISQDTVQIKIKSLSQGIILTNNSNQCLHANNFIFSHGDLAPFTNYTCNWQSDSHSSADSIFTISYATAGMKAVKLVISEASGCTDSAITFVQVGLVTPSVTNVISVNDSIQCLNENSFTVTYNKPANEHNTFVWLIDDTTSTVSPYTHKFREAGLKPVQLVVLNEGGCADTTDTYFLVVRASPVAVNIQGPLTGLQAQSEYDYSISATTGYTYQWSVYNGIFIQSSTGHGVRVKWTTPGPGSLTVQQTSDGCTSVDSVKVMVGSVGMKDLDVFPYIFVKPNPNNGLFVIGLESSEASAVQASLHNMLGEQVWNSNKTIDAGTSEMEVNIQVPDGIYLLTIQNPGGRTTKRILISEAP